MLNISVILPVFNGARYLEQALDSIRNQCDGLANLEIIATDDGSTDASPDILAAAATTLPLTVIPGAGKSNWVASTNLALARASGDYICFLHQDDRFLPNKFSALRTAAQCHPDVDVFAHPVRFINSAGRSVGTWSFPARARRLRPAEWFPPLLVQNNLAVPGVMFRRSLLNTVELLDESLRYTADWNFWLRLAACRDLVLLRPCLAEYRIHSEAQTVSFAEKQSEYAENLRIGLARHIGALDTLDGLGVREAATFRTLAALGVDVNLWLASRITDKPQSAAALVEAFRAAGIRNSVRYLHLSRVIPRALARVRAHVIPNRNQGI